MFSILLILLGSHLFNLLQDRINTSLKFIEYTQINYNNSINITWYLSGGKKDPNSNSDTEANIMKMQILNFSNNQTQWNFILDEKSSNTAENFVSVSKWLNSTTMIFDQLYVVTSDFHFTRANKMLTLIDPSRKYNWVLGKLEEIDSRYWELIHSNNIESDVRLAKNKTK